MTLKVALKVILKVMPKVLLKVEAGPVPTDSGSCNVCDGMFFRLNYVFRIVLFRLKNVSRGCYNIRRGGICRDEY